MTTILRNRLQTALGPSYEIERELEAGGMARVFVARDRSFGRRVVIKTLDPEVAATISAERFTRETQLAAGLLQANIVPVLNAGIADGLPYYVMPYVEGESLRARLRAGQSVSIGEGVAILRDVAKALEYAHAHGVMHRDIKPENILLSGGTAVVADFGIAKALKQSKVDTPESSTDSLTQIGVSIGTPAYMAPEQAAGALVDHRADIYSWGIVAYELLVGSHPFTGKSGAQQFFAAHISEIPVPLAQRRRDFPPDLATLVDRALAKDPEHRPQNASDLVRGLEHLLDAAEPHRIDPRRRRRLAAIGMGVGLAAAIVATVATRRVREAWAREDATTEIRALADSGRMKEAFAMYLRARKIRGDDPQLALVRDRVARWVTMSSTPSGAKVFWRPYDSRDTTWRSLGATPLDSTQLPALVPLVKTELAGHTTQVQVGFASVRLRDAADTSYELIEHPAGPTNKTFYINGLRHLPVAYVPKFEIGRYEVTNREYKQFLDAGGYSRYELWDDGISREGRRLSWDSARKLLIDRTGRPGPSTWEAGNYPRGTDALPVSGVSWYEARAYARFAGLELPTVFHWMQAASIDLSPLIMSRSNMGTSSPTPVGAARGVTRIGLSDMAGNVREWSLNASGGERFILGGAFNDQSYMFHSAALRDAFDRSPENGFRLARYARNDSTLALERPLQIYNRDFNRDRPVDDRTFDAYRRLFVYDPYPLDARTILRDSAELWHRERVAVRGPFNDATLIDIYLPKKGSPPYQALLYFPGTNAIRSGPTSVGMLGLVDALHDYVEAIVMSGRAVIRPIYRGMYERSDSLLPQHDRSTIFYRDRVIAWGKETRRAIDYAVTRADIDTARIGYLGLSQGSRLAPIMSVAEPRLKVAVLLCPGLGNEPTQPEIDPFNYLPRMHVPTTIIAGRWDPLYPPENNMKPFYEMLGTPASQKKYTIVEAGHCPARHQLLGEMLPFLDTYLGQVK